MARVEPVYCWQRVCFIVSRYQAIRQYQRSRVVGGGGRMGTHASPCSISTVGLKMVQSDFFHVSEIKTRSSAIAERPRCSLFKLWQKYNCEKRASDIALCYGVNVDETSFYCSTAPCLYLVKN